MCVCATVKTWHLAAMRAVSTAKSAILDNASCAFLQDEIHYSHIHILTPIPEATWSNVDDPVLFFIARSQVKIQFEIQVRRGFDPLGLAKGPGKRLHEHMEVEPCSQSHLNKPPWL